MRYNRFYIDGVATEVQTIPIKSVTTAQSKFWIKISGVWKLVSQSWVKVGATWKQANPFYKIGGSWK